MMNLDSIKILWCQPDTLSLWGVPHGMRPGQGPRDLFEAGNTAGWLWLGTPGWYGSISRPDQERIKNFLDRVGDMVPERPGEWSEL